MLEKMPDYSNYTLEQLQDAYAHISKDKFPERLNIIVSEIQKRKNGIDLIGPNNISQSIIKEKHLKLIARWEIAAGIFGLISLIQLVESNVAILTSINLIFVIVGCLIYGFWIYAGYQLNKLKPEGLKLCIIAQFFQLFKIKILGLSYMCTAIVHFFIYVDSSFNFGYLFHFPGAFNLTWNSDLSSFQVGINLISAGILSILFNARKQNVLVQNSDSTNE